MISITPPGTEREMGRMAGGIHSPDRLFVAMVTDLAPSLPVSLSVNWLPSNSVTQSYHMMGSWKICSFLK